jgi:hypothetical protein
MMAPVVDVLMITHRSPDYVRMSLPRLLETCGEIGRVWLWHNGEHEETLAVVRQYLDDPRVERFHHSRENVGLRPPTNWLWTSSSAPYFAKVDDDCLEAPGWLDTLVAAHEDVEDFGAIAAWRFPDEDFRPEVASRKIQGFPHGHRLMRNIWVQGSGHVLKRRWVERWGPLGDNQSFTQFCVKIARKGAINGWYFPFVREDHMDDPRSPNSGMTSEEEFLRRRPLAARRNGVATLADWDARQRAQALVAQEASLDLRPYGPVPRAGRAVLRRLGITHTSRAWR